MDCIFCKIINKDIKSDIIFENDNLVGFNDINPVAPTHILFVPRKHIDRLDNVESEDIKLIGELVFQAKEYAKKIGLNSSGYRLVFNTGKDAGQAVFHIHLHLIGGRLMSWPPG